MTSVVPRPTRDEVRAPQSLAGGADRAFVILPRRDGQARSRRLVRVLLLGLLAVEVALAVYCQWFAWQRQPVLAVVNGAVGPMFLATSLVLSGEREQRGNLWLFAATSLFYAVGGLPAREVTGAAALLGWLAGPCFVVFSSWAVLRYPEPRLGTATECRFIVILAVWSLLWGSSMMAVSDASADQPVLEVAAAVFSSGGALLGAAFLVLLVRRFRRLGGLERRTLAPITIVAAAGAVLVAVEMAVRAAPFPSLLTPVLVLQGVALLLLPVAFLLAATRNELARAAIADLVQSAIRSPTAQSLETGLRTALRDPELCLLYYLPERDLYVDAAGLPRVVSSPPGRVAVPLLTARGQPLAVVVVEAGLQRHAPLLQPALAACGLSLEVAQLQATLQARLQDLRASRARIVEAGLAERRRLERDLHDGVQHRLVVATMGLAAASGLVHDDPVRDQLRQVRDELRGVLADLRDLAHGLHPAVLTNFGLREALRSLADRCPLPVAVDVPERRWRADVESTLYFVACEGLANAVKHAHARRADIAVRTEGRQLVLQVSDDGVGGADADGTGLAGLRDRLLALDGDMQVYSPPGAGTQVTARLPVDAAERVPCADADSGGADLGSPVRTPAQRASGDAVVSTW